MAHRFAAFAVPDDHVLLLAQHPGLVHDYLEGRRPTALPGGGLPGDWPTARVAHLGSWGVNHDNTGLYHWILNGGPEPVSGSGALFQAWHAPDHPAATIKLDPYNTRFALRATDLPELATLVERVTVPVVLTAFRAWCQSRGVDGSNLDEDACEPFVDEFHNFGDGLRQAIARGQALIW
jgi:hypothetical protein